MANVPPDDPNVGFTSLTKRPLTPKSFILNLDSELLIVCLEESMFFI